MKRIAEQSLYEILEIPRGATREEVARAYERARTLYAPGSLATYSLMAPEEAQLLGRRIEEAREVLLDPTLRASYDAGLAADPGRSPRAASTPVPPVIPALAPGQPAPGQPPAAEPPRPAPAPAPFAHPDGAPWTGQVLRRARESRGLSIQALADRTKVTRHHLENVEADRYDRLPAPVYLRGILMSLSRELRLDGQKVARSYLEQVAAAAAASAPPPKPR